MFLIYLAIFKGKGFLSHATGIEGYFRLREQEIQLGKLGVGTGIVLLGQTTWKILIYTWAKRV